MSCYLCYNLVEFPLSTRALRVDWSLDVCIDKFLIFLPFVRVLKKYLKNKGLTLYSVLFLQLHVLTKSRAWNTRSQNSSWTRYVGAVIWKNYCLTHSLGCTYKALLERLLKILECYLCSLKHFVITHTWTFKCAFVTVSRQIAEVNWGVLKHYVCGFLNQSVFQLLIQGKTDLQPCGLLPSVNN